MTPAGERNRQITLQKPTRTSTASGFESTTYADIATVWAKRTTKSAGEDYPGEQKVGRKVEVFNIHFRNDIDNTWRIKSGTDIYDIHYCIEVGFKEELEIEAEYRDNG